VDVPESLSEPVTIGYYDTETMDALSPLKTVLSLATWFQDKKFDLER
jgi:hypothetical protein